MPYVHLDSLPCSSLKRYGKDARLVSDNGRCYIKRKSAHNFYPPFPVTLSNVQQSNTVVLGNDNYIYTSTHSRKQRVEAGNKRRLFISEMGTVSTPNIEYPDCLWLMVLVLTRLVLEQLWSLYIPPELLPYLRFAVLMHVLLRVRMG